MCQCFNHINNYDIKYKCIKCNNVLFISDDLIEYDNNSYYIIPKFKIKDFYV